MGKNWKWDLDQLYIRYILGIKLEGSREYDEAVLDRIRTTLAECENGEFMSVDIENYNVE